MTRITQMAPRQVTIDRGDLRVRIDRVLLRHLRHVPGVTRNRLQRLIDAGAVCVNDHPVTRASSRVATGDRIVIELPDPRSRTRPAAETLPIEVCYEDDCFLIVNKPAGQVSHPAFRNMSGTLLNALLAYAERKWTPALLSRLDKNTSGLVLVAKTRNAQLALQRIGPANAIEKDYIAIVEGVPPKKGTIDLALDRDPWDRRRVIVRDRGGVPSVTRFERLRSMAVDDNRHLSLIRCRLITGRTHQIRVHLAAKGWPILGDATYGSTSGIIGRQALHAWRVAFRHPFSRCRIEATAPIPQDIEHVLDDIYPSTRERSIGTVPSAE